MRPTSLPFILPWSVIGLFLTCLSAHLNAEADPYRLIGRNIKPREVPVSSAILRRQKELNLTGKTSIRILGCTLPSQKMQITHANVFLLPDINVDLTWRDAISFSATHQNPAMAPPVPMPGFKNSTVASAPGFSPRGVEFASLQRRDGALHCDNGPCVDGR